MRKLSRVSTFPIFLLLFQFLNAGADTGQIPGLEVIMPPSLVALSGDLHINIVSSSFLPLVVQLSRLDGGAVHPLTTFPVYPEASALNKNLTVVKVQCGYFSKGGQYYVQIKKQPIVGVNTSTDAEMITKIIDVRWPMPQLTVTPENLKTYPESPVTSILTFPDVQCLPIKATPATALPEFWLELHYCGHSLLNCGDGSNFEQQNNKSGSHQVLYSEQVRGLPGRRVFILRCELFGLQGYYSIFLRPINPDPVIPRTSAYVKVDVSDQFVFNVHALSIFPCDTHSGINVLYQYPSCILADADRVRLFARLRANVASLAPPTTLEYISEQKVVNGYHSLRFDCDLFSERYVEYCFVYVSQSISGAVADVREDCVPTLPVSEHERGGWSPWSQWTPCSSTCIGGTRSRYRLCDSPPPRYGAKFCEGPSVETEKCGTSLGTGWECIHGAGTFLAAEIPEIQAEVGPYCRCGCVVHLGQAKPRRLLATSSQSCPGRTFWLIQSDDDCIIQFRVDQFNFPCGNQWLKIRDGSALSSALLADLSGQPGTVPTQVNSTGASLLLEFYTDDVAMGGAVCDGGFLAEASQIRLIKLNLTEVRAAHSIALAIPDVVLKLTAVHIAAIFFLSGLVLATIFLGMQYAFRYRKYHVTQLEDQDSLAASSTSLKMSARAQSNATLLSEVISLTRMRPLNMNSRQNKHSRLRESVDCEREGEIESEAILGRSESPTGSTATLVAPNESVVTATLANPETDDITPVSSAPTSPRSDQRGEERSSTLSEKDASNEKESSPDTPKETRGRESRATLTNGRYSSAASMVSTATIRSTNAKATKEKRNREKLLAGPNGSDFSIAAPDNEMEFDYYDYNVVNAGAAPGSYLGMDPAFLVWIPPLDESGEILPCEAAESHEMTDIRPKVYVDPGSNKESPEEESLLPKPKRRSVSESNTPDTPSPVIKRKIKKVYPLVHGLSSSRTPPVDNRYLTETEQLLDNNKKVTVQLHDYPLKKLRPFSPEDMEKETKVEKSPSASGSLLDEIRFADDDEDLELTELPAAVQGET